MIWQFAFALDIGDRNEQQDRVAILHSDNAHLLVVADGMGGHEDGAAAAQTVIDIASRQFSLGVNDKPGMFLAMICMEANKAILAQSKDNTSAPGSTCVMLYLEGTEAYCAHVGDSRMYQFRDNKLFFKTTDHSVSELLNEYGKTTEDVLGDQSTQHQLYMCLGGKNDVIPKLSATQVKKGDLLFLCSDGIWSQLSEQEILANLDGEDWSTGKAEQIVRLAKQQGQGQSDNISLAWAYCLGTKGQKESGLLKWLTG